MREVAAFTFTDSPNSYAERTGRPANVGVIGVAVFRERASAAGVLAAVDQPECARGIRPRAGCHAAQPRRTGVDSAAAGERASKVGALGVPAARPCRSAPAPAPKLGTGHGEREFSYASPHRILANADAAE